MDRPERQLLRYRIDTNIPVGEEPLYCYALDDAGAQTTAAQMIVTLQNEGRGRYKDLKLTRVVADPDATEKPA